MWTRRELLRLGRSGMLAGLFWPAGSGEPTSADVGVVVAALLEMGEPEAEDRLGKNHGVGDDASSCL